MSKMQNPYDLSHHDLCEIVEAIQREMYLDENESGTVFWSPAKEWSCVDLAQFVADMLARHGLVPTEVAPHEPDEDDEPPLADDG